MHVVLHAPGTRGSSILLGDEVLKSGSLQPSGPWQPMVVMTGSPTAVRIMTGPVPAYDLGTRWVLVWRQQDQVWRVPLSGDETDWTERGHVAGSLGAPAALAWLLALSPLPGGAVWLASRRARRRIARIETAADTPQYRVAATCDREARISEARTQVARLEAVAVLVMILLATPGLVALARGLTLSLGLR